MLQNILLFALGLFLVVSIIKHLIRFYSILTRYKQLIYIANTFRISYLYSNEIHHFNTAVCINTDYYSFKYSNTLNAAQDILNELIILECQITDFNFWILNCYSLKMQINIDSNINRYQNFIESNIK